LKRETHHHIRQTLFGLGGGILFSAVALLIVARELKGESVRITSLTPLVAAIFLAVFTWFVQGAMFSVLLRPLVGRYEYRGMVRLYLASHSVGDITPFMGGEVPYEVWGLSRAGLTPGMGGALLAVKAILNFTVLVSGTVIGFLLYKGDFSIKDSGKILLAIAVGAVMVWVIVAFLLRRRGDHDEEPERRPDEEAGWRQKAREFYADLRSGFMEIWRKEPGAIFVCTGLHIVYWLSYTAIGALALMASGWNGNPLEAMAAQFVVYLLLPLSPTPGGSGAAELGFAALVSSGSGGSLLAGIMIWRGLSYYLPLVVGAFFVGRDINEGLLSRLEGLREH